MRVISFAVVLVVLCTLPSPVAAAGVIPAIQNVLKMLNDLVTKLTNENTEDDTKFAHFTKWVTKEMADTEVRIGELQTKIEDTKAVLGWLYATRGELNTRVSHLKGEVATTQNQINTATEKRNEEHSAHVIEQQNFNNAIAACNKAVEILGKHYGDGSKEELSKPQFMSLVGTYMETIRKAAVTLDKKAGKKSHHYLQKIKPHSMSFLEAPGNDRFEAKTGEALTIVDQVQVLASTFAEDQQTAVEEENRLQELFNNLMAEKMKILHDLQTELAQKTKELNQCNQDIASGESKLAMLEKNLLDDQAYLASLKEQFQVFGDAFKARKKDRNEEMAAVNQALTVLAKYNKSLLQRASHLSKSKDVHCKNCVKAVSFLKSKAKLFQSALLEAAATASMGSEVMDEIIKNLDGLLSRIDEEQKFETEHKEWCEEETGLTTKKREDHRYICDTLKGVLADLAAVVVEKKEDLGINAGDQNGEEMSFDERTELRGEEKSEFNQDLADHIEAINALNDAINILAKYYASRDARGLRSCRCLALVAQLLICCLRPEQNSSRQK